jgi:diaminopimelate decarboxylase
MKKSVYDPKLLNVVRDYQTPLYLFDTDILARQIQKTKNILGDHVEICYAMKANPFLTKSLVPLVDFFEVCSPGEFSICERAEIPGNKIVLSGVHKSALDVDHATKTYGGSITYTAESLSHWQMLNDSAEKHQVSIPVLLRLTSGNQFGMDEDLIKEIIQKGPYKWITIEGIQYFSGTQKKTSSRLSKELTKLDAMCGELKEAYGFTVKKIEYGPGLPVCYFEDEENKEDEMLNDLSNTIKAMTFGGSVTLEMGRFIAASCGYYVTQVVDKKTNKGLNYCIVDGGCHQVNYYGQMLAMKKPPILHLGDETGDSEEWTICGSLCTVNDMLCKQYPLKNLQLGDYLVFQKTGAYSVTEGMSLFLSRDLPTVLLYSEKDQITAARQSMPTNILNYFQS